MYTTLRNRLIRDAILQAVYAEMKKDASIYIMGEGASMKVHFDAPMIEREFPDRVITFPISEDGNTNFAVGASLMGMKPIVDVITADFIYRTMDAICNTAAKINFVSGGVDKPKTVVIKSEFMTAGPTTGQRVEALFTHIPGLNVVVPSTPYDAKGLMATTLTSPGVTIFFEDREISDKTTKQSDMVNPDYYKIPFGSAKVRRKGENLTIVSYAVTVRTAESVIDEYDISCDLIDLRSLYPVDYDTLYESVRKTGKLLIVEPDVTYAGVGAEISANISENCFNDLKKPVMRLGAPRTTIPASARLHKQLIPAEEQILQAIRRLQ
ncbi:MAG: hypothetical protein M1387_02150 [Thaumarchaeota archaeon]|nr:hypothetical protein [Nitrososphaerota archaeon]